MYKDNKIIIGKNDEKEATLLLNKVARHGLITGASGSGKTITLKVLAESLSEAGVPVIITDVKGDLAGLSEEGTINENIQSRIDKLKLEDFKVQKYPVTFFDVYGTSGHPIRTTVTNIGPRILSRMLNLSDAQEGVLTIVFKVAKDNNIELIDLNDLRKYLNFVGENRKDYTFDYGNITPQSVGSIQRAILTLQEEDGDLFFGKPDFQIKDFIRYDSESGFGNINILHSVKLFNNPTLYSSMLLWILNSLYNEMPEVGDVEKPKLVMFLDEAHLLFNDMPEHLLKQIIQIVKLIRSKGIGLYFISQTPNDINTEILAQLSNRIQHVLRSYTPQDEKIIKSVSESFRTNPKFNTIDEIKSLGTGEALISLLDEKGEPTIVDRYTILPPQSKIGTIDDSSRERLIYQSWLYNKYENKINTPIQTQAQPQVQASQVQPISTPTVQTQTMQSFQTMKSEQAKAKETQSNKDLVSKEFNKTQKKVINKIENKIATKIVNSLFK